MRILELMSVGLFLMAATGQVQAACGGSFGSFVEGMKKEARAKGHSASSVDRFFASVRQDPKVIRADRAQGIFQMPFILSLIHI